MYHPTAGQVGSDRIRAADRHARKPAPGTSNMNSELHILSGVSLDSGDRADQRVASMLTRRICNRHHCQADGCGHRNHRRDVSYLALMLDILGLPGTLPQLEDGDYALPGTRSRSYG
jgi:hypothetical protein